MKFLFSLLIIAFLGNCVSAQELRSFTINGLYGYKKGGSVAIPAKYSYAGDFVNSRAAVLINKKWGFIDTRGRLVIPNEYERVESFADGFARFYVGNKMGLLDSMGNKVIPAYCDEITVNTYQKRVFLRREDKKGVYFIDNKVIIEPKYASVFIYEKFIFAQTDQLYDVFTMEGNLIAEDVLSRSEILGDNIYSNLCDLSWRDSMYFVDKNGNKISQTYQSISFAPCDITRHENDYSTDFHYDQMYFLYLREKPGHYFVDQSEQTYFSKFHMLYGEHFITDGEYSSYDYNEEITLVEKNEQYYKIEKNGDIVPAKYIRSEPANDYTLLFRPGGFVDVAKINRVRINDFSGGIITKIPPPDTIFVEHFDAVRLIRESYVDYQYNPDYDEIQSVEVSQSTPFNVIEIAGEMDDTNKWALYDLDVKKYCSKFDEHNKIVVNKLHRSGKTCYVFMDQETRLMAYSIEDFQSDYEFSSMELTFGSESLFLTRNDSTSVLLGGDNLTKIDFPKEVELINSTYITKSDEPVYSEITGEYESGGYEEQLFSFTFDIFETISEPKKYGFIDGNDRIILPQYDELISNSDSISPYCIIPVVGTRQGDLFGFYNLQSGVEVKPQFQNPLNFKYDPSLKLMYAQPDGEEYYLTDSGKKMYSVNQSPEVFIENKKQGLFVVSDFNLEVEEQHTILPAAFRSFTFSDAMPYVIAENQLKKNGLVNFFGDTLIPFEYYKIEQGYFSQMSYPSNPYIIVYNDDKKGLYCANWNNKAEAKYDRIDALIIPEYNSNSFVVTAEKRFGLLNNEAIEVLPCNYLGVDVIEKYEVIKAIALESNQVKIFSYMEHGGVDTINDVLKVDFVIEERGYRKTEGGYFVFDVFSGDLIAFEEELDCPIRGTNCIIFEENKLLGLKDRDTGKIKLRPSVQYFRFNEMVEYLSFENGRRSFKAIDTKKKK